VSPLNSTLYNIDNNFTTVSHDTIRVETRHNITNMRKIANKYAYNEFKKTTPTRRKSLYSTIQAKVKVTTDSQSASLSWCQAPICDPLQNFLLFKNYLDNCKYVDVGRPL
jgi:hypothetical protein